MVKKPEMLKTHLSHQEREALGSKVADVFLLVRQEFTVNTDLEKQKSEKLYIIILWKLISIIVSFYLRILPIFLAILHEK